MHCKNFEIKPDEIRKLRNLYGDDFYLVDSKQFKNNYHKLCGAFLEYYSKFNIAYSYKTNYLPLFCRIVNENGGYAEVVSEMELELANKYGVRDEKIIWNGPVKDLRIMEHFLTKGGTVNIDNLQEWCHIAKIAKNNMSSMIHVGIRCNFDVGDGVLSRFGIDVESDGFNCLIKDIIEHENIRLTNLQCHFAKRMACCWSKRTKVMLELYTKLRNEYGIILEKIDMGGGISGEMNDEFSRQLAIDGSKMRDYAECSAKQFADFFGDSEGQKPEMIVEPGTALAADTMVAVFRVENIREIRGKWFATVNGSQKNIHMQGINPPIQVIHMNESKENEYVNMDISGYTCMENDCLYHNYNGGLAVGDYLVFKYCGSYSFVFKSPFIRPDIPIIDIGDGINFSRLLKRRETVDDILRNYQL